MADAPQSRGGPHTLPRSHLPPSNLELQRRFRDSDPGDPPITTETSRQHRQDACTYPTYDSTPPACRDHAVLTLATVPQVVPHQAEAGQGPEAEQAHPPVDPPEDRQHHQVCSPRNTRLDWTGGRRVNALVGRNIKMLGGIWAAATRICDRTATPHRDKRMQRTVTDYDITQQVQRQETSLAQDPHRYLSDSPTMLEQDAHVRGRPSQHKSHINYFSDRTGEIEAAGMAWHC